MSYTLETATLQEARRYAKTPPKIKGIYFGGTNNFQDVESHSSPYGMSFGGKGVDTSEMFVFSGTGMEPGVKKGFKKDFKGCLNFVFGTGYAKYIKFVLEYFDKVSPKNRPKELVLSGYSRGAVACIKLATRLWLKYGDQIKLHLVLTDPVPGPFRHTEGDEKVIPPNVATFTARYSGQKTETFMEQTDLSQLTFLSKNTIITSCCLLNRDHTNILLSDGKVDEYCHTTIAVDRLCTYFMDPDWGKYCIEKKNPNKIAFEETQGKSGKYNLLTPNTHPYIKDYRQTVFADPNNHIYDRGKIIAELIEALSLQPQSKKDTFKKTATDKLLKEHKISGIDLVQSNGRKLIVFSIEKELYARLENIYKKFSKNKNSTWREKHIHNIINLIKKFKTYKKNINFDFMFEKNNKTKKFEIFLKITKNIPFFIEKTNEFCKYALRQLNKIQQQKYSKKKGFFSDFSSGDFSSGGFSSGGFLRDVSDKQNDCFQPVMKKVVTAQRETLEEEQQQKQYVINHI